VNQHVQPSEDDQNGRKQGVGSKMERSREEDAGSTGPQPRTALAIMWAVTAAVPAGISACDSISSERSVFLLVAVSPELAEPQAATPDLVLYQL
jgi:hypothetical protein